MEMKLPLCPRCRKEIDLDYDLPFIFISINDRVAFCRNCEEIDNKKGYHLIVRSSENTLNHRELIRIFGEW
jgi:hypothetical protein